jgi:hypothetical protein
MRKLIPTVLVLFLSVSLSAQYKKASFFGKQGRTYELGTELHAVGNGQGSPMGLKLAFGRDQDGMRFFSSWELQYIPSYKYAYDTKEMNGSQAVHVNGTTKSTFIYGVNYSFQFLKNDDPERIVKPFAFFGFNIVLSGGIKSETYTPETYDLAKQTDWADFNMGLIGGVGALVNLNQKFGLRIQGLYNKMVRVGLDDHSGYETFKLFDSHPSVSVGLRFRLVSE